MSALSRSGYKGQLLDELGDGARSSGSFDQDVAAQIGRCIAVRRTLCGLSQQQLGARLGIGWADVEAYEQGAKRMSCKLLLQTAKQLKARPRFFF
jgi:ribosome-binding protein aMBF1 (putative translation factor)